MREVHLMFCGGKLKLDFHMHGRFANYKQRQPKLCLSHSSLLTR
jgi:hypothetical protein